MASRPESMKFYKNGKRGFLLCWWVKTKSAPLPERPCEQLTYCAKNESVQGDYINRVEKRHNCRITGKTKATCYGGHSTQATRYPQRMSADYYAVITSGWQCDQCAGLLVGYQPLGSIPRRFSSERPNSLSQLARLMPSLCASLSNCSFSSGEIRILNCGDCPSPLGLLSRLIVDKWSPIELAFLLLGGHLNTGTLKKAKPEGARNTNGLLTTNDSKIIEVAMLNHTTHPQGRDLHNLNKPDVKNLLIATASQSYDSYAPHKTGVGITTPLTIKAIHDAPASFFVSIHTHTHTMVGCTGPTSVGLVSLIASCGNPVQSTASELTTSGGGDIPSIKEAANMATIPTLVHSQTAFIWRFIIFGASESQIIHVTAWTEREARNHCPSGCVAVLAARIRQGVSHA